MQKVEITGATNLGVTLDGESILLAIFVEEPIELKMSAATARDICTLFERAILELLKRQTSDEGGAIG